MQSNKTCPLIEDYINYLVVIKGRTQNTIKEYRTDLLMFFSFVLNNRGMPLTNKDFSMISLDFIKSIVLNDMYNFFSHCQIELN